MNSGFKGFSKKLYSKTTKILNITAKAFSLPRPSEIFYSVKDGGWSDIDTWATVSGRSGRLPDTKDDVYILHNVVYDYYNGSPDKVLANLYVRGKLTQTAGANRVLSITGNLQCTGTIDMTSDYPLFLVLYGKRNYIDNFIKGRSQIIYASADEQDIMPIDYNELKIGLYNDYSMIGLPNKNTKNAVSNIKVDDLEVRAGCKIEMWHHNLTVYGPTMVQGYGELSKSRGGNILFYGFLLSPNPGIITFSGNPNVELRGGFSFQLVTLDSGTGTWKFTTNNQNITSSYSTHIFKGPLVADADITVNFLKDNEGSFQINDKIDGVNAGSSFVNKGNVYFNTANNAMVTAGTFDRTSFVNLVGYVHSSSHTIQYTNYSSLYIGGYLSTKTAVGNTTLDGSLRAVDSTFQLSTHNLTVGTTTTLQTGVLSKSGAGTVLFTGTLICGGASGCLHVDFTGGNPSVECRGGIATGSNANCIVILGGTGKWSFTTNNQLLYALAQPGFTDLYDMEIASDIVITNGIYININNTMNGLNSNSKFLNNGGLFLKSSSIPMTTGIIDVSTLYNDVYIDQSSSGNLINYNYWNLVIRGAATISLQTNLTLIGSLQVWTSSIFELGAYNLTVNAATSIYGVLSKSGAGNLTFIGNLQTGNSSGNVGTTKLNFTGNPNVELRAGYYSTNVLAANLVTGTGLWTFTTNNQSIIDWGNSVSGVFDCNMLISGAITLAVQYGGFVTNGYIDGNNASSKLDNRGYIEYKNDIMPMTTGLIDVNTGANTFKYNKNGNQDVKGGTYDYLELGGSGIKKLQGNVTVPTAKYSLTGSATKDDNGFTFTLT